MGLLRWLWSLVSTVFVLASLLALAEVSLRLYQLRGELNFTTPADCQPAGCPLAIASWYTGWELRPMASVQVKDPGGETFLFRTNSLGYRGDEIALPKPPGLFRIVCLGDETLLAPEIPEESTFCQQLRTLLQARTQYQIEVINAALPHGCPLTAWIAARHRLIGLQPDLVLLHVTWSDLADARELRRFTTSDRRGIPLCCTHPQFATPACVDLGPWRRQLCLLDWGCRQLSRRMEHAEQPAPSIWLNMERLADSTEFTEMVEPVKFLAELCVASHCRCVVWTTPYPWQLSSSATTKGSARKQAGLSAQSLVSSRTPFEKLMQICASWQIPCLDASLAFPRGSAADPLFLADQPRWSAQGHRVVAEFVSEQLIAQIPGPWSSPYFRSDAVPASYHSAPHPDKIPR